MVNKNNKWLMVLKNHKEGLIIGALTGVLSAYYLVQGGYDLSSLYASGKGLVDNLLSRNASVAQSAITKLYLVTTTLGATIGYLADELMARYYSRKRRLASGVRKRRVVKR